MAPIMNFTCADRDIGLLVRSIQSGPENELITAFIEQMTPVLKSRKRHYAIFQEPLLETGFPDIVIVSYSPHVYDNWKADRNNLTTLDLKILYHLHFIGGAVAEKIEKQLGVDSKNLVRSLERLLGASLIRWYAKQWMPRSLKTRYAVGKIAAIEAKIKNWASAFKQAELNSWFASETYVLSPVAKPQEQVLTKSERLGIGIYSMPTEYNIKKITKSRRGILPSSYASWLFNEWIGRRLNS